MNPFLFVGVKQLFPDCDPQDREEAVQDLKLPARPAESLFVSRLTGHEIGATMNMCGQNHIR
jgi:hypothetical protein